jgi:hypothetical protein
MDLIRFRKDTVRENIMARLDGGLSGFLPKAECDSEITEGSDCPTTFEAIYEDQQLLMRIVRVQRQRCVTCVWVDGPVVWCGCCGLLGNGRLCLCTRMLSVFVFVVMYCLFGFVVICSVFGCPCGMSATGIA